VSIEVKLDNRKLLELIKKSPLKIDAAVRATAFDIQRIAVANAATAYNNITAANKASIYTKTSRGITGKVGEAGDQTPDVQIGEAIIAPSMEYSARLEFGFVGTDSLGRHYQQAPRPYLTPAAAQTPQLFDKWIGKIFKEDV
jgi:hypothetical protein